MIDKTFSIEAFEFEFQKAQSADQLSARLAAAVQKIIDRKVRIAASKIVEGLNAYGHNLKCTKKKKD